jgi:transposase
VLVQFAPQEQLCGCAIKRIGEAVSEKLNYTAGAFTVQRHVRGK